MTSALQVSTDSFQAPTEQVSSLVDPAFPILLAVPLALGMAWADFIGRLIKQLLPGGPVGMGPDALWMGPLMNFMLLGVPATVLAFAIRRYPRRVTPALVLGVLGFIALSDVLLSHRRLHAGAELLLALGLAVRLGSFAAKHYDTLQRKVPRITRAAVVVYVVVTAICLVGRSALERWALISLPHATAAQPNVLLLVLDTERSFDASTYGYDKPTTPHLSEWATQGVRFEHAFSTASWTLPSVATMFTGRYPSELSADLDARLDGTYPTLAEILRASGYATGSFVANESYCTWQFGLARGFIHLDGYPVTLSMFVWSSAIGRRLLFQPVIRRALGFWNNPGSKPAADVNEEFLRWLDHASGHPFFAFLNYYDAHHPALPPAPFDTLFGTRPPPRVPQLELNFDSISPGELVQRRAQYDGAIAYMDHEIDSLLRELRRRRALDNTVVVIAGDHGEHWGDHQRLSHGNSLYRQLLQVPLVIRYPARIRAGAVVGDGVSLRDVPATILDLAGVGGSRRLPGTSLAGFADVNGEEGSPAVSPIFASSAPKGVHGSVSLIAGSMHYIRNASGVEELYDADRDSLDAVNLTRTVSVRELLPRLRALADSVAMGVSSPVGAR